MKKNNKKVLVAMSRLRPSGYAGQAGGVNKKNTKVLVAMSGGVDSSVAAALLLQEGYEVAGAFMVNYDEGKGERGKGKENSCWIADYRDAVRVAAKLGIQLLRLDFTKEYSEMVLSYMKKEYDAGRTPNPDVMCNKFVKFGVWLDWAREKRYDFIATGHYARLGREIQNPKSKIQNNSKFQIPNSKFNNIIQLLQAIDENKDQTYFLHQLTQEQLKYTLFPIGDYTKDEVRKLAKKFDLPTADKEESMGICFIGEVPMKEFLQNKLKIENKAGEIVTADGTVVGRHEGLGFYTIGQRYVGERGKGKGERGDNRALFVVDKRMEKNQLVVGYEDDLLLYKKEIEVGEVNWIRQAPEFPLKCLVRLRHRQTMQTAVISEQGTVIKVVFEKPQRAVTPGQFAVFYLNSLQGEAVAKTCLGGGVIM